MRNNYTKNIRNYGSQELSLIVLNDETFYTAVNQMVADNKPVIDALKILANYFDFTTEQAQDFADTYLSWNK